MEAIRGENEAGGGAGGAVTNARSGKGMDSVEIPVRGTAVGEGAGPGALCEGQQTGLAHPQQ